MVLSRQNGHARGSSLPLKKKQRRSTESDGSEDGLLLNELDTAQTPSTPPRWARPRQWTRFSWKDRRSRWLLIAVLGTLFLLVAGGIASLKRTRQDPREPEKLPVEEDGTIPLGQSRYDENDHEIFWWEQFDRYRAHTDHALNSLLIDLD